MNTALEDLLQQPGIWRGGETARNTGLKHVATGYTDLDQALPGGGWPLGGITEVLHEAGGIGELRLLMPALARLSRQGRWVAMIAPPHIPFAPALAAHGIDLSHLLLIHPKAHVDQLWALEQALKAGTCGAVLAWPGQLDERALRRLQLAAETGQSWGVLFRPLAAAAQASPAMLRLELEPRESGLGVRFLKARSAAAQQLELTLQLSEHVGDGVRLTRTPRLSRGRTARSRRLPPQMDLPLSTDRPTLHRPH